ncbi:unnamed protein product [Rhizoctonia solani]|nr:unnamed protein product [Rhizoctonia solani]
MSTFNFERKRRGQPSSQFELGGSPVFIDSTNSPRSVLNGNHSAFSSPFSIITTPSSRVISSPSPASEGIQEREEPTARPQTDSWPEMHRPPLIPEATCLTDSDSDDLEDMLSSVSDYVPTIPLIVANSERNAEFHEIFSNLPLGDCLIEDYRCSSELHSFINGRLFISENHICFYANNLGQGTRLIIPFHEVTDLDDDFSLNNIRISTRNRRYIFALFLSRNTTYKAIQNTWQHWRLKPTGCACGKEGKHFKEPIIDTTIPGAPKSIYNLMFTGGFLEEFMAKEQKLTDIQISDWYPEPSGSGLLARGMTYTRPHSIWDDFISNKWELKDETLHIDDDYVSVLTTTPILETRNWDTYTVKTRVCIMRARGAASRLVVTTEIKCSGEHLLSPFIQELIVDDQRMHYVNLERAIHSHISASNTGSAPESIVEDPEMTRAYEASNIMTRPLDESPHAAAAHHYLLSVEGTADSAKGDKPSVNKSAASFVPAEFASTIQHPNETMDILQSQSPQYVASVMHGYLIQHGCLDLESSIDPSGFSSSAVAEGGFGDVWTGRTHNGGTKLAIKVLRFASLTGDTAKKELKRITREIYNWSKPDHENINKLIGVFMFRERLGMVSEWMEHGNLRQYLGRNDDTDRRQLCIQIARGVAYLHGVNMVHGDLKACNILVSSTGILKITDFDYSIFPECSLAFSATSRMGGGTLRWMVTLQSSY